MRSLLCRVLGAEPRELPALGWAFAYFFLLLCSYYILRPVRDEMAVQAGVSQLQWLFTATFIAMLVLVPVFGALCAKLGRAKLLPAVYLFFALNLAAFWADAAAAYRVAIGHIAAAGCTYLQLDDVSWAYLCDPKVRENFRANGDDPATLPGAYAAVIRAALAGRPAGMTVTMHTCRGNFRSAWFAAGGYADPVVEAMFSIPVDAFFMEWDTERAGGFEPLRLLPSDKRVVLGLVTTKTGVLESRDALRRRIDEAAKYVPLERLCLSPQCGFASTHHGNTLTEDEQWRKLELVVGVARDVWGG